MAFWKKNGAVMAAPREQGLSLLGEGSEVVGTFVSPGNLRIEGRFQGKIQISGRLVIAPTAHVVGEISAKEVLLAGIFEGEIQAQSVIEIAATAQVRGKLHARNLEVASGAQLRAHCMIGELAEEVKVATETLALSELPLKKAETVPAEAGREVPESAANETPTAPLEVGQLSAVNGTPSAAGVAPREIVSVVSEEADLAGGLSAEPAEPSSPAEAPEKDAREASS
ncbi:MAG: polymer-forming cytoskeletal protein [Bacteroidia bacterium]|nr:polymer-forming cytoskeletal protein [Bacteroidia bacterium]MDW8089196.1 polymer-forming cytoskeletal protein [Bacteroidia bacterium]